VTIVVLIHVSTCVNVCGHAVGYCFEIVKLASQFSPLLASDSAI
jgi:hypothetical protein